MVRMVRLGRKCATESWQGEWIVNDWQQGWGAVGVGSVWTKRFGMAGSVQRKRKVRFGLVWQEVCRGGVCIDVKW